MIKSIIHFLLLFKFISNRQLNLTNYAIHKNDVDHYVPRPQFKSIPDSDYFKQIVILITNFFNNRKNSQYLALLGVAFTSH